MGRPGNWLALLLAAVCIGLGVGYWRERLELGSLRAADAARALAGQHDQRELADLRKQVGTMQAAEKARVKRNEDARKARAALSAAQSETANPRGAIIRYSDIIKDHPEFAALRDKETRRNVVRQYGDAIATLNLPPDKAAQLKSLLVERQLSQEDAREAAQAAGLKPGTPDYGKAMSQAYQDVEQQITDLIGKEGTQTLQQAQAIAGYRTMVTFNYAPDFTDAGMPLSDQQQLALAQALSPVSAMRGNPAARTPAYRQPDPDTWLSPANQDMLSQLGATFSPAQLDILKSSLADQNHRNAILQPYFQAGRNGGTVFISQ